MNDIDLPAELTDAAVAPLLASSSSVEATRLIPTDGAATNQRQDAMNEFGITCRFQDFRYEQLTDAVNYAELKR